MGWQAWSDRGSALGVRIPGPTWFGIIDGADGMQEAHTGDDRELEPGREYVAPLGEEFDILAVCRSPEYCRTGIQPG